MPKEQVIIIGGGPAGVACAVQLKRYGIDPLLVEKDSIGGLVKNAWRLDNYPGFPDGIGGAVFADKLKAHVERFDIRYSRCDIRYSRFVEDRFILNSNEDEFTCSHLVIATGTKPKPHFESFAKKFPSRIFTEVFPLREIKGKNIEIIGAGDAAFDYAMTLSAHNSVHILNRGTEIKCVPALLALAKKQANISYSENSEPSFSSDYTIFATGREPELCCLSEELINMQEQLQGDGLIYLIGDVKNGMVRQTSVAVGDGIRAAMAIREKISR